MYTFRHPVCKYLLSEFLSILTTWRVLRIWNVNFMALDNMWSFQKIEWCFFDAQFSISTGKLSYCNFRQCCDGYTLCIICPYVWERYWIRRNLYHVQSLTLSWWYKRKVTYTENEGNFHLFSHECSSHVLTLIVVSLFWFESQELFCVSQLLLPHRCIHFQCTKYGP